MQQGVNVLVGWSAAKDCAGAAVSGYNLYRRESGSAVRSRLNSALIPGLSEVDGWLAAGLASGQTYYYALTAVDADGDESVASAEAAVRLATVASEDSGSGSSERRRRRRGRRGRGALLHLGLRRGHLPGAAHAALRPGAARLPDSDQPREEEKERSAPGRG